jgi:hypothetical protein
VKVVSFTLGTLDMRKRDAKHQSKTFVNYIEFLSIGGHDISTEVSSDSVKYNHFACLFIYDLLKYDISQII